MTVAGSSPPDTRDRLSIPLKALEKSRAFLFLSPQGRRERRGKVMSPSLLGFWKLRLITDHLIAN